jgi:hypothetical protein
LLASCEKDNTPVPAPEIEAGSNDTTYVDEVYTVNSAIAKNASVYFWSHNGEGLLSDSATLTPSYTPSAVDAGKVVTLVLHAFANANTEPVLDSFGLVVLPVLDSLSMASGYSNDIFYSFSNGLVTSVPRTNWHFAFYTDSWSSSIITNAGANVQLFTYPLGDTTAWNTTFDVSGIDSWKALNNSDTSWIYSAFEANQKGHPDYGWGKYNSINHDVVGDSLYVLKLADGSYKKVWIIRKVSVQNTYYFKVADLDGQNEVSVTLDCRNYASKNFVYYNALTNEVLDREPAKTDWDILFTKYYSLEQLQMGNPNPVVTGVLLNRGNFAIKVSDEAVSVNTYDPHDFSTSLSVIGYDWKTFSNATFSYTMVPNRKYFVKTGSKKVYKLVFKSFAGSSTGKISFDRKEIR